MKIFVVTCLTNYGETVEIISALSEKSAKELVSENARDWGFEIKELDISKEANIFIGGGA